ncbi:MAG TPA: OmpA family protein [Polyangiales bacterium]|nr:OmpA family protein [Polyangiales bacterium]
MKHSILTTLTSGVLASALCACASGPTRELSDARRAYDEAEDSPAAQRNPAELQRARVALDRAEAAHDEDPGSAREKRLAERAEYRAKLAMNADHARPAWRDEQAAARREEAAMEREDQRAERNARVADRDDRTAVPVRSSKLQDRKAESALQNLGQVANVKQEPRGVVITLSGSLLFPSGDEKLSPVARKNLDQVAHALAQQPADTTFQVEGYTDDTGSPKQNEQLAEQRAKAVADHLIASGIDASRIKVVSHGEDDPVANNDSPEGRAANRRVEIVVEQNG